MYEFFAKSRWLDGQHRGKVHTIKGYGEYSTAEAAMGAAALYHPLGHIYRHGATGNRHEVIEHGAKPVRAPRKK